MTQVETFPVTTERMTASLLEAWRRAERAAAEATARDSDYYAAMLRVAECRAAYGRHVAALAEPSPQLAGASPQIVSFGPVLAQFQASSHRT
jgi:hypothetical protein